MPTKTNKIKTPKNKTKEVKHICSTCSVGCQLWDDVCNIDEDFVRECFNYDCNKNSVCITVAYCKNYKRRKNAKS